MVSKTGSSGENGQQEAFMPEHQIQWNKKRLLNSLVLFLITLIAFARVFSSGFIDSYDDELYVTLNPFVTQGLTWQGFLWSLTSFESGNWHPLTWWSHMLDVSLFGSNPAGHHAVSLFIHAVNAVLLYAFMCRATGMHGRSFLVAALFSLHPLHVESVAWVAERKDVLCAFFGFAALHYYLSYVRSEQIKYYLAVLLLLSLGLMAKPMLVTIPCLLLVLDYWPLARFRNQPLPRLLLEKIPLLVPVAVISVVTIVAQRSAGALVPIGTDSFALRLSNAVHAYAIYLRKFFVPYDLAAFYPYVPVSGSVAILAGIILAAISVIGWRLRDKFPWFPAGWMWYLGMLVPVIGIVRVGEQAYADRYTYLPLVGVSILVVFGGAELLARFAPQRSLAKIIAAVVMVVCAMVTWTQTGYWQDSYSLYSRDLAVTTGNWHAHFGMGNVLAKRQEFVEAISHYNAVLESKPLSVDTHNNLASCLRSLGRTPEAIQHFKKAVEINPNYLNAYFNLALTLAQQGDYKAAETYLQTALSVDPMFQEARGLLEQLYSMDGSLHR
jgi:tetratricopeptide (TPR) repeat protein